MNEIQTERKKVAILNLACSDEDYRLLLSQEQIDFFYWMQSEGFIDQESWVIIVFDEGDWKVI